MSEPRRRRGRTRAGLIGATMAAVLSLAGSAVAATSLTQVSQDPYTNTSSFHRTQLEPDTFAFGSTIVAAFQTGRFSNGGSSNTCWATSTNAGGSWSTGCLPGTTVYATPPGPYARISDPAAGYDAKHDVWMIAGLAIDASVTGKAVVINRSTDGGLTWQNPVSVSVAGGSSFYDKEWVTCDDTATSPSYGNCYVEWDDAAQGDALRMSRSTDGGLTWTASTVPNTSVIGGQPVVQPGGTVVVPIEGSGIDSFVSTNGGQSYTGPYNVATISSHGVAGDLRTSPLPSAEIDGAGKVYVVWQDCRFRASCSANDIVLSTSTDGKNWSGVVRIPIDATTSTVDHFIPGIGVDRSTSGSSAHLGLTYYFYPDRSCSVSTCRLKAGYVSSADGGATWSAPKKILGAISLKSLPLTTQGYMVGDYISTSIAGNGRAYPVIANATAGTCTLGQITSCNEFMVAPTNGLRVLAGVRPVGHGPGIAAGSGRPAPGLGTAF